MQRKSSVRCSIVEGEKALVQKTKKMYHCESFVLTQLNANIEISKKGLKKKSEYIYYVS